MAAGLPLLFFYAALCGEPVVVELPNDGVEGVGAAAFLPDEEVEAEGGEGALLVVADEGVGGVFVGFVVFVPGGVGGLGEGLFQTAFVLAYAGDVFGQEGEVVFRGNDAAAGEDEVVVVGGDAFECPELFGVDLTFQAWKYSCEKRPSSSV